MGSMGWIWGQWRGYGVNGGDMGSMGLDMGPRTAFPMGTKASEAMTSAAAMTSPRGRPWEGEGRGCGGFGVGFGVFLGSALQTLQVIPGDEFQRLIQ